MGELVSVIVPVYKVESCLDKCVDSIVQQTYRDLEIILVDDQSPDRCPEICDCWAQRDHRVRVIHKTNEGVGKARNTGLAAASGSFVMFVDSDDYLPQDAVQVLLERLIADGSDMAIGKNLRVFEDGHTDGRACAFMKNQLLSSDAFLTAMGEKEHYSVAPWGKLYTRKALEGIAFPTLVCGQDLWVFPLIVLQCETISVVEHLVYYYFQRPGSTIRSNKDKHKLSAIEASHHMTDIFLRRGQLDCAEKWMEAEIDLAGDITNPKEGVDLVESLFDRTQLRQLLQRSPLRVRGKWFLLHHPGVYRCVLGAKRKLTALLGK